MSIFKRNKKKQPGIGVTAVIGKATPEAERKQEKEQKPKLSPEQVEKMEEFGRRLKEVYKDFVDYADSNPAVRDNASLMTQFMYATGEGKAVQIFLRAGTVENSVINLASAIKKYEDLSDIVARAVLVAWMVRHKKQSGND